MNILDRAEPYRDALEKRALTIRALAGILGCNESYLSRVLSPTLKRVESTTKLRGKQQKLTESRRLMREKHAFMVLNGQKSLKRAAADARCSEKTIKRYMERLSDDGPEEPQG